MNATPKPFYMVIIKLFNILRGSTMSRNIVIRKCQKCRTTTESENFAYLGDGVFSCPNCQSKYTFIYEVIDPDEEETK